MEKVIWKIPKECKEYCSNYEEVTEEGRYVHDENSTVIYSCANIRSCLMPRDNPWFWAVVKSLK